MQVAILIPTFHESLADMAQAVVTPDLNLSFRVRFPLAPFLVQSALYQSPKLESGKSFGITGLYVTYSPPLQGYM